MSRRQAVTLAALAALSLVTPLTAWTADVRPLATVTVESGSGNALRTSVDGVVEAVRQTTLAAQVAGAIVGLPVKAGDTVRAGQELVRMDARAAQQSVAASAAQVQAAQAALNVASKDFERQQQLRQKQYISQAALERAQAQRDAAQAQVQALQAQTHAAQAQSGFFVLNAPYAGVVTEVPATLGDMAMPGKPLLTLYDPSALRVTAAVPQTLATAITTNPKAVQYELPGVSGYATPTAPVQVQVLPAADAATHTVQVRLLLPTGVRGVTPGVFARVWLPGADTSAQDPRPWVPTAAVLQRGEVTGVYVIASDGKPQLRQVRTGRSLGDRVEILSGLRNGEKIAADARAAAAAR